MLMKEGGEQLSLFAQDGPYGKMCPDVLALAPRPARISASSSRNLSELWMGPWLFLDLTPNGGNLLGQSWEPGFPSLLGCWTPATGSSPKDAKEFLLSSILQDSPHPKYYLTATACLGILRRAKKRGKELPPVLEQALRIQAAIPPEDLAAWRRSADTQDSPSITAFAANQRDELRDLHDVSAAVCASPGMKQQTFVAQTSVLNGWDTQQSRISTVDGVAPTLAGADGGGGRRPGGLVMAAGFCPKPSAQARSIGYQRECSPTLTSNTPAVICLNDQGGSVMNVSENITGTLRAQMHSHQPLVMATQQGGAEICENLCPTIVASAGMSGNNGPVVLPETYAISGTAIDRQPENGGNGLGIQREIAPSLTTCDRPAVFSQQRCDEYKESGVTSTQAARQYKDATDLVVAGLDCRAGQENGDLCGTLQAHPGGGYSLNTLHPVRIGNLIRRLTPLECEKLQGFPPGWTDIPADGPRPGSSDSARYKALGNSIAVPCVEFIMMGIAAVYAGEA